MLQNGCIVSIGTIFSSWLFTMLYRCASISYFKNQSYRKRQIRQLQQLQVQIYISVNLESLSMSHQRLSVYYRITGKREIGRPVNPCGGCPALWSRYFINSQKYSIYIKLVHIYWKMSCKWEIRRSLAAIINRSRPRFPIICLQTCLNFTIHVHCAAQ